MTTTSRRIALAILFLLAYASMYAQNAVTGATTRTGLEAHITAVTSPSDASGDVNVSQAYDIFYGQGNNLFIDEYTIAGPLTFGNFVRPDTLILRRFDASSQLIFFYDYISETCCTPAEVQVEPTKVENPEGILQTEYANVGIDNVLANTGTNFANIERVDNLFYSGL